LVLALTLVGCDAVEGMRDMKDSQQTLKGMIREDLGVQSLVGFSLDNGVLVDVSFSFSASEVADLSVSELVRATRSAVDAAFKTKPQAIYIQLATTPEA
jgi:hypothetical protein